ncbi:MAG: RNA polymerase sigma factor [Bacteroidota bacterium]
MNQVEFVENFNHLENKLFAFAYKLTKDQNKAKDLVQEAALKAYRNIEKFREGTNFKAWISTILRNTFINNYRRAKVRNITSEPVDTVLYKVEERFHTKNEGTTNIQLKELHSMIDELKPKYRIPFLMHYKGYEYAEIAAEMNIPVGTVKSRLFVARKQLRKTVQLHYAIAS